MPNHSPEHLQRLTQASASSRRAAKIARLIQTAPRLDPAHVTQLAVLLRARLDGGA